MTDSSDPSRSRRKDGSREPPTIDLKATVLPEANEPAPDAARDELPGTFGDEAVTAPSSAEPSSSSQAEEPRGGFPPPPRQAPPSRRAGGSFASLAGAGALGGILGGVLGAGLMAALDLRNQEPPTPDPRVAALEQRLGAAARQESVDALERRLAALETAQRALSQRVQEAASRPALSNGAALDDLTRRLAALETRLQERLQERLEERRQAGEQTQRSLQQVAQEASAAREALERRLAEQDTRLAALMQQMDRGSPAAIARVVLAERLTRALASGAPYADALDALARSGAEEARLQALRPFAQGGAPTPASLAQDFRPLAARILRETQPTPESWGERLARAFDNVVTIRPVDGTATEGAPGALARIEAALERGDLAAASTAFDALPEPARRIAEEWGGRLKERAAAEAASRALAAEAVAALNAPAR